MTREKAASLLNIKGRRLQELKNEAPDLYDWMKWRRGVPAKTKEDWKRRQAEKAPQQPPSLRQQKTKREIALLGKRIEKLGVEVKTLHGELVPLAEARAVMSQVGAGLRAKLLELTTLAPLLANRSEAEIAHQLDEWARKACGWFASQRFAPGGSGAEEADSEPVGADVPDADDGGDSGAGPVAE
jgi:hypothetical protein